MTPGLGSVEPPLGQRARLGSWEYGHSTLLWGSGALRQEAAHLGGGPQLQVHLDPLN